jgi:uncharacterized protein YjbI with pentapeptide repeats
VTKDELATILDKHAKWLRGEEGGAGANLAGAYLDGANLAGANLAGANLARANLAGAYLAGANLARANLAWANLAWANLAGAYLAGANLAWANLAWANLDGAKIYSGEVARWIAGGDLLAYSWTAWRMKDGRVVLRYGCEEGDLATWPDDLRAECEQHVPREADRYEAALSALVAYVAAIAVVVAPVEPVPSGGEVVTLSNATRTPRPSGAGGR